MSIRFVEDRKPLLIAAAIGDQNDAEYASFLGDCTALMFSDDEPFVYIYDGSTLGKMAPRQRKLQAEWIERYSADIRRCNRGVAFVFVSPVQRGLLRAVHWLSPPPYPFGVFSSLTEAKAWARERLEAPRIAS